MRDLIAGVVVALAAGLMGGAAMKPDLNMGDLPAPQLFTTAQVDQPDAMLVAYPGKAPDYVYGTDFQAADRGLRQCAAYPRRSLPAARSRRTPPTTPPTTPC
jgi:hypothetical protein